MKPNRVVSPLAAALAALLIGGCAASSTPRTAPAQEAGSALPVIIERKTPPRYHRVPQGTYAEYEEESAAERKARVDTSRAAAPSSSALVLPLPYDLPGSHESGSSDSTGG